MSDSEGSSSRNSSSEDFSDNEDVGEQSSVVQPYAHEPVADSDY